jgi:putative membrane protein
VTVPSHGATVPDANSAVPHDTAAVLHPSPQQQEWRRLSSRMLLIHPVRELIRSIPALAGLFLAGRSTGNGHWWSLIGVGIVILLSIIRWATTRYRITPDQIQLRSGLLRRKVKATPADRVRTVDVTAHALHRALGLAKVEIGTGISDRKKEGLVLDGLTAEAAHNLRAELLHRGQARPAGVSTVKRTAAPESAYPQADSELELVRLDPAWLRYAPFTLSGALTGLALVGFGWRIISQAQVNAGKIGAVESASRHLSDTPIWLDVVQVGFVVVVFISVLSVAGYLLSFWNFRLSRHEEGTLHVSRGLITSRSTSIESRRLRGVEISQPLLLRAVGGARLLAIATGLRVGHGAERGGSVLVPPAPLTEVDRVAATILQIQPPAATLIPRNGSALRRRMVRTVVPCLAAAVVSAVATAWGAPVWIAGTLFVLLIPAAALGFDRYRSLGHGVLDRPSGRVLISRFGSLVRRRVIVDAEGIIGWNFRQTFFQRRAGLVTLAATTAAGRQRYPLTDITPAASVDIARAVTPGLLDEFLVASSE